MNKIEVTTARLRTAEEITGYAGIRSFILDGGVGYNTWMDREARDMNRLILQPVPLEVFVIKPRDARFYDGILGGKDGACCVMKDWIADRKSELIDPFDERYLQAGMLFNKILEMCRKGNEGPSIEVEGDVPEILKDIIRKLLGG